MILSKKDKLFDEKMKDFVKVLKESSEYEALSKAREDFESDEEAKKLLSDFQQAQQTYAIFKQGGFPGVEEEERKLRDLQNRLQGNTKINKLIATQQDLQVFITGVINGISQSINFPFTPQQTGGCCG